MPELPEMQALAERLEAVLAGAPFESATALQFSGLKTFSPAPSSLAGRTLTRVGRRGKYVWFDLGGPRIMFHLSQGGRVDVEDPPKITKPKGAVVRFRFAGKPAVLVKEFGTERKAGWWVVAEGEEGPLAGLGPEPDSKEFKAFINTADDRRQIHTILRDQRTVAGIGRGYSDDICHRAQVSPFAPLAGMDEPTRTRLLASITEVLAEGLAAERKRTGGLPTKIGDHWIVHNRAGEPCPRCSEELKRVSFESREVAYCPTCQTGGKILADRRLSKLLK